MTLFSIPAFIGVLLSFLATRLGIKLAMAMLIIGVVGAMYAIFATVIIVGLQLIEVPSSDSMVMFAMEAFPSTTPQQIAAIFAARMAQWVFRMKTAAIRYYMAPSKSLL